MIERIDHPNWAKRIRCLAALLAKPATPNELVEQAWDRWRWPPDLALNVLAAGDGTAWQFDAATGQWVLRPGTAVDATDAEALNPGGRSPMKYKPRACATCQSTFTPTGSRQTFCSDPCKAAQPAKPCLMCRVSFTPTADRQSFCKDACKAAYRRGGEAA